MKRQFRINIESQQLNALKAFDTADIVRNIFKPNVRPSEDNVFYFTQIERHFVLRRPFLYMFDFSSSCNVTIFRYQKRGIICEFYDNEWQTDRQTNRQMNIQALAWLSSEHYAASSTSVFFLGVFHKCTTVTQRELWPLCFPDHVVITWMCNVPAAVHNPV